MDAANRTVLIRFAALVAAALILSLAAPAEARLANFAGLLNAMMLVSLVFAVVKREPLVPDRLTHLDEAAGFIALSLLAHAFVDVSALESAGTPGGS